MVFVAILANNWQGHEANSFYVSNIGVKNLKSSGDVLIDKVYSISIDNPCLNFTNLSFQAEFNYYLFLQIVSPHECTVRVILNDPEEDSFDLFCKFMKQSDGISEIPFGTSLAGKHAISILLDTSYNLNIYVRIEKGSKCLHDVLSSKQLTNVIQYDVIKFQDSSIQIDYAYLETDSVYKIFFGRVSPISIEYDNNVTYAYSLFDAEGIEYCINWKNESLEGIGLVTVHDFGTASAGIYITNLTINCNVEFVNVAYAIVYDHVIGDGTVENNTNPEDDNTRNEIILIPEEWMIGTTIFIGATLAILIVMLVNNRKKNSVSLNIRS